MKSKGYFCYYFFFSVHIHAHTYRGANINSTANIKNY